MLGEANGENLTWMSGFWELEVAAVVRTVSLAS
jgi:hypothetical protein